MDRTQGYQAMTEYAKFLGCESSGENIKEIGEFYKSIDASKLALGMGSNPKFKAQTGRIFEDSRVSLISRLEHFSRTML